MPDFRVIVRWLVFATFCGSALIAIAAWAVRTRRISPFSALSRGLRSVTDPILRPIETRVVRSGGTPAQAGWWLVIGVAVLGVVLLSVLDWATSAVQQVAAAAGGGPRAFVRLAIVLAYNVFFIALLVRIVGSWIGAFGYSRWMRPAYVLTDWIVEPLRRALPPLGVFDLSPLAALFVVWAIQRLLLSFI
jgi:YggT family protein